MSWTRSARVSVVPGRSSRRSLRMESTSNQYGPWVASWARVQVPACIEQGEDIGRGRRGRLDRPRSSAWPCCRWTRVVAGAVVAAAGRQQAAEADRPTQPQGAAAADDRPAGLYVLVHVRSFTW